MDCTTVTVQEHSVLHWERTILSSYVLHYYFLLVGHAANLNTGNIRSDMSDMATSQYIFLLQ